MLILKIVESVYANSKCIRKMHNDLLIICLAYCLVLHWILDIGYLRIDTGCCSVIRATPVFLNIAHLHSSTSI